MTQRYDHPISKEQAQFLMGALWIVINRLGGEVRIKEKDLAEVILDRQRGKDIEVIRSLGIGIDDTFFQIRAVEQTQIIDIASPTELIRRVNGEIVDWHEEVTHEGFHQGEHAAGAVYSALGTGGNPDSPGEGTPDGSPITDSQGERSRDQPEEGSRRSGLGNRIEGEQG